MPGEMADDRRNFGARQYDGPAPRLPGTNHLIAGCVGSAIIFAAGWIYGVRYQGLTYVVGVLGMTIAAVVFLGVFLLWNRRSPSLANSATFHFVLFAWLGTYAVPYLG